MVNLKVLKAICHLSDSMPALYLHITLDLNVDKKTSHKLAMMLLLVCCSTWSTYYQ